MRLLGKIETFLNLTLKGFGIVMQANMTTTNNNDQKVTIQNRGIRDQLGLLQYKLEPRCFLFIMTMAKKMGVRMQFFPLKISFIRTFGYPLLPRVKSQPLNIDDHYFLD